MVGFVRRAEGAREPHRRRWRSRPRRSRRRRRAWSLCGVDTLGIQAPEVDALRERVAEAARAPTRAGILLNWNHTHHAPPGGLACTARSASGSMEPDATTAAYVEHLHGRIVEVCARWPASGWSRRAVALGPRRRPTRPSTAASATPTGWCVASAGIRTGWSTVSVPVAAGAPRATAAPIATIVGYGAHTVTTGVEVIAYSPDYPGAAARRACAR